MRVDEGQAPEFLFKYRSLAEDARAFTRDIIINRTLWCGSASSLNDPFDCYPIPRLSGDKTLRKIRLRSLLRRINPEISSKETKSAADNVIDGPPGYLDNLMSQAVEMTRKGIGILSLSADPAIPKMWQMYGDEHRGICLRFHDAAEGSRMFSLAQRVRYVDTRPSVKAITRPSPDFTRTFLLTKTMEWAHEQEWRLVDPAKCGAVQFPTAALTGVIFGATISNTDREEVLTWVDQAGSKLEIMQAMASNGNAITIHKYCSATTSRYLRSGDE